jgi:isopenicillin N synthase-like dioxygenase
MTQMAERAVTDQAPAAMIAGAIPLIDVAGHLDGDASSSRKAATQLRWAFENIGFYYLSGHGVPQSLIDRTYEEAARFHAQPMARKLALKVQRAQYRLSADLERGVAPGCRARPQTEPERGLFPAARARPRRSGGHRKPTLSRAQSMARRSARLSRDDPRVHAGPGGAMPSAGAALRHGA